MPHAAAAAVPSSWLMKVAVNEIGITLLFLWLFVGLSFLADRHVGLAKYRKKFIL